MQCPACSTSIPLNARFCRQCGRRIPRQSVRRRIVSKIKPNVPASGFIFLAGIVLGPACIFAGAHWHLPALVWTGATICFFVLLILLLNAIG